MFSNSRRRQRKLDPLLFLMLFVIIGMSATVSYQVLIYSSAGQSTLARQGPAPSGYGG
jgi:hypothetical protein